MYDAPYELGSAADGYPVRIRARGRSVLSNPMLNRRTAFTPEQRQLLGLQGLLPSGVTTLEGQLRRVYAQYRRQPDDLAKNVLLANMRDRNEVLFYRLLAERLGEMLPIVYTPTVGKRSNATATNIAAHAESSLTSITPRMWRSRCATTASRVTTSTCW